MCSLFLPVSLPSFLAKPEIFINAIGFVAAIVTYIVRSRKDLRLQHRNNYFKLELEASRIFTVALQNPDIPRFLRGDLDHDPKSSDPRLHEQVFWFVSQELNIFEIAISLRNKKTITSELFATWCRGSTSWAPTGISAASGRSLTISCITISRNCRRS